MKRNRTQRGMTLIEMVIALSISAAIVGGLGAVIYTVVETTGRGNAEIQVLRDLQAASYWIREDAKTATEEPDSGIPDSILFTSDGVEYTQSTIYLSGTAMLRDTDGTVTTIASHIISFETYFESENRTLTYRLVASSRGKWEFEREMTEKVYLSKMGAE